MELKEGRWVASWSWFHDVEGWIFYIWMQQLSKTVFTPKMNTQNRSFKFFSAPKQNHTLFLMQLSVAVM